jgi:ABC-type proline/glycine betaine transport system substrate-binding protein
MKEPPRKISIDGVRPKKESEKRRNPPSSKFARDNYASNEAKVRTRHSSQNRSANSHLRSKHRPRKRSPSKFSSRKSLLMLAGLFVLLVAVFVRFYFFSNTSSNTQTENTKNLAAGFQNAAGAKIIGIESGTEIMKHTLLASEKYGLSKNGWSITNHTSADAFNILKTSALHSKPIVTVAWEPNPMFAVVNLRKLADPQGIYNDPQATKAFLNRYAPDWKNVKVQSDVIATLVSNNFSTQSPRANDFLHSFEITSATQSQWTFQLSFENATTTDVVNTFFLENQAKINTWEKSQKKLGTKDLTIGIPRWASAVVKAAVMKRALEDMGYRVSVKTYPGGMGDVYKALANHTIDMTPCAWLPKTQNNLWSKYQKQIQVAGINVALTWTGLAVPEYTNPQIQSISDLVK